MLVSSILKKLFALPEETSLGLNYFPFMELFSDDSFLGLELPCCPLRIRRSSKTISNIEGWLCSKMSLSCSSSSSSPKFCNCCALMSAILAFSFLKILIPFDPASRVNEIMSNVRRTYSTRFGKAILSNAPIILPMIITGSMILARS